MDETGNLADLEYNFLNLIPESRQTRILDIGCGKGRVMRFLMEHGYNNVDGIDIDPNAIEWTRDHVSSRVEVVSDLVAFLGEHKDSYGLLIVKDVIYYIEAGDLDATASAMYLALKPSGLCLVEVFNGATLTGPFIKYKDHGIRTIFTEQSLSALLETNGFVIEKMMGARTVSRSMKGRIHQMAAAAWRTLLRGVYLLERGRDEENPRILTKKIIAVASRPESTPSTPGTHA